MDSALDLKLRDLMAQSLSGDPRAYERLLKDTAILIRGYLRSSVSSSGRSPEEAEDLVQEVLLSLHRKKHLYDAKRPFVPWVLAIARYRLIDHLRAQKRRVPTAPWDELFEPPEPAPREVPDVESLLSVLTARQREVVKLAKLDRMPLADIALKFQMSLSAVKATVHRAMKALRENGMNN